MQSLIQLLNLVTAVFRNSYHLNNLCLVGCVNLHVFTNTCLPPLLHARLKVNDVDLCPFMSRFVTSPH